MDQKIHFIDKISDPLIQTAKELETVAGRFFHRKCLLEGAEHIGWALAAKIDIENVFYHSSFLGNPLLSQLVKLRAPCYQCSHEIFKYLQDDEQPELILATVQTRNIPAQNQQFQSLLILDRMEEQKKLGEAIQVGKAFGVDHVATTSHTVDLYFKETITSSKGKVFEVESFVFNSAEEAITFYKNKEYQIVLVREGEKNGEQLSHLDARRVAIVLGHEGESNTDVDKFADCILSLPKIENIAFQSTYEARLRTLLTSIQQKTPLRAKPLPQAVKSPEFMLGYNHEKISQVIFSMLLFAEGRMRMKDAQPYLIEMLGPIAYEKFFKNLMIGKVIELQEGEWLALTPKGEAELEKDWKLNKTLETHLLSLFAKMNEPRLRMLLLRLQSAQTLMGVKFKQEDLEVLAKEVTPQKKEAKKKAASSTGKKRPPVLRKVEK